MQRLYVDIEENIHPHFIYTFFLLHITILQMIGARKKGNCCHIFHIFHGTHLVCMIPIEKVHI